MAFIQIIEMRTDRADDISAEARKFDEKAGEKSKVLRSVVTRDRNDPTRHLVVVFFDSYEAAMENSNLPETQEFAARLPEFATGEITFHDLDVIEDSVNNV